MGRQAEINFRVTLDEKHMPERIDWDATDAGEPGAKKCEAILISLWDSKGKDTLGIDLWTKNMMVDDMNVFVHQTLLKLSSTYKDATNDSSTAKLINDCAKDFAEKLQLVKR